MARFTFRDESARNLWWSGFSAGVGIASFVLMFISIIFG